MSAARATGAYLSLARSTRIFGEAKNYLHTVFVRIKANIHTKKCDRAIPLELRRYSWRLFLFDFFPSPSPVKLSINTFIRKRDERPTDFMLWQRHDTDRKAIQWPHNCRTFHQEKKKNLIKAATGFSAEVFRRAVSCFKITPVWPRRIFPHQRPMIHSPAKP